MKFSGKMCFKIILKVTKNQAFTFSLEDTFFEKPQWGGGQFDLLRHIRVKVLFEYKTAAKTAYGEIRNNLIPLKSQKALDSCYIKHNLESEFVISR